MSEYHDKAVKPFKERKIGHPEADIQKAVVIKLEFQSWYVRVMHASAKNAGWPDLFACHKRYGQRWIEIKLPKMQGSKFTVAQFEDFPKFCANGSGVWILTGDSDYEINKLFSTPNWYQYLEIMR